MAKNKENYTVEELKQFIDPAKMREIEEQQHGKLLNHVLNHYSVRGLPVSEQTFKKSPINVQRWIDKKTAHAKQVKDLEQQLKWLNARIAEVSDPDYRDAFIMPIPEEERKAEIARFQGWADDVTSRLDTLKTNGPDEIFDGRTREGAVKQRSVKPTALNPLKPDGTPKADLLSLYRYVRGNARIDEDGDLVARVWPDYAATPLINKWVKEGLIRHDDRSGIWVIPKNLLKKMDPYHKDYNATFNSFYDTVKEHGNWDHPDKEDEFRTKLGRVLTLRGAKNISKTNNPEGAFGVLREFIDDNFRRLQWRYNWTPVENAEIPREFNSLNEIRNAATRIPEIEHAVERRRQLAELRRQYGGDGDDIDEEELQRRLNMPFQYSMDIINSVKEIAPDWRLADDNEDLYQRGVDMHNCVGGYTSRVRARESLILMNGNITAEIQLQEDDDGNIIEAHVQQIKAPYNAAPDKKYPELKTLAQSLVGKHALDAGEDEAQSDKAVDTYFNGGFVDRPSNMSGKPSMVLENEENKLLKAAEGYKGTPDIEGQLAGEAKTDGLTDDEVKAVVSQVLSRLKKTESGKNGGAFGTPHKAEDRYIAIKQTIGGLHGFS
jgi:hypothetical protein